MTGMCTLICSKCNSEVLKYTREVSWFADDKNHEFDGIVCPNCGFVVGSDRKI